MLQKPVGFRAVHGLQRSALLRECGVKFVVAAALLFGAFDQRAQPVGGFEQPVFLCRQGAAVGVGISPVMISGASWYSAATATTSGRQGVPV